MRNRCLIIAFLFISISISSFSQTSYIPDDVFEQTLIDLGHDSGPLDNYIKTVNLDKITYLDLSHKKIKNLKGIEDFLNLQTLIYDDSLLNVLKKTNTNSFFKLINTNNLFKVIPVTKINNLYTYSYPIFSLYRNNN